MGRTWADLLERSGQLDELNRLLDAASRGEGQSIFVGGEAGIGKTALSRRFAIDSSGAARILVSACDPLTTSRPLGPMFDIAADLGTELAELLKQGASPKFVFQVALTALSGTAGPTLLVIEDAHWADEATLDFLRFLCRRVGDHRILLLVTYRNDEIGARHPLRVLLGDLASNSSVHRMLLPLLTERAVEQLASAFDGIDASALYLRTGGNPFFVTEVLASGSHTFPETVGDAVFARIARLSAEARSVLETAAVLGLRMELHVLAVTSPLGHDGAMTAIEECVDRGMLRAGEGTIAFQHELAREAVYHSISPVRLSNIHRRVLDVLSMAPRGETDPAVMAFHAEAARESQKVLIYAPAAAAHAAAMGAHREAAAQYARAVRHAGTLPPVERAALFETSAYEHYLTGEVNQSIAHWNSAIALRRASGDHLRAGEDLRFLSRTLWIGGRRDLANAASREAIELLEQFAPGAELAMAYSARSQLLMLDEEIPESIAWGTRGIGLAERLGHAETLTHALNNVGFSRLVAGDEEGFDLLNRSLRLSLDNGFVEHAARAHMNIVAALVRHYELQRAERALKDALVFCDENELHVYTVSLLSFQLLAHFHQGRWDEAGVAATQVLAQPPETTYTSARPNALLVLGRLRSRRGEPGARHLLDQALESAELSGESGRIGAIRAARAEAAWLEGAFSRAGDEALFGFELALKTGDPWLQGELAVWLNRVGRPTSTTFDRAELLGPFALELAGEWDGAAEEWNIRGCPFEMGLSLAHSDQEEDLRQALTIFEQLDARSVEAFVTQRLRRIGARSIPRGPRLTTRANVAGLTVREMNVLALMSEGLSDRVIADRLFISISTAEKHVASVRVKLGAHSRTEAVNFGIQLGLIDPDAKRNSFTPK